MAHSANTTDLSADTSMLFPDAAHVDERMRGLLRLTTFWDKVVDCERKGYGIRWAPDRASFTAVGAATNEQFIVSKESSI